MPLKVEQIDRKQQQSSLRLAVGLYISCRDIAMKETTRVHSDAGEISCVYRCGAVIN